jgi:Ser/Thr protein kinase RdoA (MazF antagonist)
MSIDDTSTGPGPEGVADLLDLWDVTASGRLEELSPEGIYRLMTGYGVALILNDLGPGDWQVLGRFGFEYIILRHLQAAGIPVALPLADRHGRIAVAWRGHNYTLSPCLPDDGGALTGPDRHLLLRNYGAAIARMHRALATFPQEDIRDWIEPIDLASEVFDTGFPIILPYLTGEQAGRFRAIRSALAQKMPAAFQGLTQQLIHRDCHAENLLSCGTQITGIVDWDHLAVGPRILDPAYFAVQLAKRQVRDPQAMARWLDEFPLLLAGYQAVSPLLESEKAALPYVMIAVPVLFAYWAIETGHSDDYIQTELDTLSWSYDNLEVIQRRVNTSL